jgi:DDE family transposase
LRDLLTALMIHVVSKGRALPLAWRVRQAPKGHFPAELHIALGERIRGLIPAGVQVVWLGDGACDGTRRQHTLQQAGWSYACRTATSTVATWESETCRLDALGACLQPGRLIACKEVHGTREAYGPILGLCCWAKGEQEPLYVVSHLATAEAAWRWYEKRCRIETFFADQKSRGFPMHTSHMADVQRLSRL